MCRYAFYGCVSIAWMIALHAYYWPIIAQSNVFTCVLSCILLYCILSYPILFYSILFYSILSGFIYDLRPLSLMSLPKWSGTVASIVV